MNKKNLVLGGILVVLLLFSYLYQEPFQNWKEKQGKIDSFLSEVSSGDIAKIEIIKDNKKTTLLKENKKWKIGEEKGFYIKDSVADSIDFVLENISKKEIEVVSKNVNKKDSFKTDEQGIVLNIFQEGEEFSFIIGKPTADFAGNYISQADGDKTYKIKLNLNIFDQTEWREDQIFSFMKERANKIRFQYPTKQFFVEKVEEKWSGVLPYSFPVSEEKINEILDILSDMKAEQIPEQKFEGTGLEKNLIIVQVLGENVDETIMVGDLLKSEDENKMYFAKKGSSDSIYLITKEQRDLLYQTTRGLR